MYNRVGQMMNSNFPSVGQNVRCIFSPQRAMLRIGRTAFITDRYFKAWLIKFNQLSPHIGKFALLLQNSATLVHTTMNFYHKITPQHFSLKGHTGTKKFQNLSPYLYFKRNLKQQMARRRKRRKRKCQWRSIKILRFFRR